MKSNQIGTDEETNNTSANTYFAALPPDELTRKLTEKIQDYYEFATRYGFLDLWRRGYMAYYGKSGTGTDTSRLSQAGTNGETFVLKVNNFRSLLNNLLTLTTSQRPAIQPKATNSDFKSFQECVLARGILDYYMETKCVEKELKKACEFALLAGEGFIVTSWNATSGEQYGVNPETGAVIYDGDLDFSTFHPIDVIRDCRAENGMSKWRIVRQWQNKYDLAAKYPEMADDLTSLHINPDYFSKYTYLNYIDAESDYIPVYTFFHEPSDALPNGRQIEFVDTDIYLTDGPLAYKRVPVFRIAPADYHGTPFGYTVAYDLMGIQTTMDSLYSIITTNQLNYGIQNILIPRGSEINVVSLAQGLNAIEYDHNLGEPKPLNLVSTPKELFEQIVNLGHAQETLSGVNSVARGNPEASLKSGAALALIAAQAVQFNGGLQASYNRLIEDVGSSIIEILQEYATTPRIAAISGKSNRSRVQEFKGTDISSISRVTVESVNPISKTAAGRLQMAQDLIQAGQIKNPQHYLEVVSTGTLDPIYEHEVSQILNIRSENEQLSDGKPVIAIITDPHLMHIKEHATCLDDPGARANPEIVANVTKHIQDHINILKTADPTLLQMLGQQSLAQPPAPPPAQGGPGGPPQPPQQGKPPMPSAHGAGNLPHVMNSTNPLIQQAQNVKMAGMPSLPEGSPNEAKEAYSVMKSNQKPS